MNIELIYDTSLDKFIIESNKKVIVNKSLKPVLEYYLKTGSNSNSIRLIEHYLLDIFNGTIPPIQNKQQLLQLDRILPDWFILYDTDKMLIEHYWYLPTEARPSNPKLGVIGCTGDPDYYYYYNRLYAWKILELMKDRIDFKLRPSWERNVFI